MAFGVAVCLVGLLAAPPLLDAFGPDAVFYGFGGVGLAWTAGSATNFL